MKHLTKEEVKNLFKETTTEKVFQKSGKYLARIVDEPEMVITILSGVIETVVKAQRGHVILRNIVVGTSGETYSVSPEKYAGRYRMDTPLRKVFMEGELWTHVSAIGKATGGFYSGETVTFEAPWGGPMLLEDGDFLASPVPLDNPDDIYRIARQEFLATYEQESIGWLHPE